jgi:hypothetical protein
MIGDLDHWLRTSILGMIAVGALGSVATGVAVYLLRKVLAPLLLPLLKWIFLRSTDVATAGIVKDYARVRQKTGDQRIVAFYAYQVMKFTGALFLCAAFFTTLLMVRAASPQTTGNYAFAIPAALCLLSIWWAGRAFLTISFAVHFDEDEVERMITEHNEKLGNQ